MIPMVLLVCRCPVIFIKVAHWDLQVKAANFAEQAARAKLNATYLDIMDQTQIARESIENTDQTI